LPSYSLLKLLPRKIQKMVEEFSGSMSHTANQGLNNIDSGEKKSRGTFRRRMACPFFVLCCITVGIAVILLGIFLFSPQRNTPISLLSDLKAGPKVFRTNIPETIIIAQNFFRGKITVVVQPNTHPAKIKSLPPVEKKAGLTQPIVAPPEHREPQQETELSQPLEIQTKFGTTPPLPTLVPTQSTDASSEKNEPQQEFGINPPVEPQSIVRTIQPTEEQSVSSQPAVVPSEKIELPVKTDLRRAEVRPQLVKKEVIRKTEGRIIHREKWLLSQGSSYYTIQLMGVRKEALLFDFVEKNQLLKQNEIAYYKTTFKDKPWFQLLYGIYATKKDAQAAADNLPLKIRKSSPWIRRLFAVQKTIRGKMSP
jgi:septal ring-binding cell division protein DamX